MARLRLALRRTSLPQRFLAHGSIAGGSLRDWSPCSQCPATTAPSLSASGGSWIDGRDPWRAHVAQSHSAESAASVESASRSSQPLSPIVDVARGSSLDQTATRTSLEIPNFDDYRGTSCSFEFRNFFVHLWSSNCEGRSWALVHVLRLSVVQFWWRRWRGWLCKCVSPSAASSLLTPTVITEAATVDDPAHSGPSVPGVQSRLERDSKTNPTPNRSIPAAAYVTIVVMDATSQSDKSVARHHASAVIRSVAQ